MKDKDLLELLSEIQEGYSPSLEVVELLVLDALRERGIVPENDHERQAYYRFFNKVRFAETNYNKARNNITGIKQSVIIIANALQKLEDDLV